jgi:hypothetical protein
MIDSTARQITNSMIRIPRASLPLILGLILPWVVRALPQGPVYNVLAVTEPPVLDGRLDDPCWQDAPVLSAFTQVLPAEGAPPSEPTEVRIVYTPSALYIGIRCHDSAVGAVLAKQMRRDANFNSDDYVAVAFDTFGRASDGYIFAVNPAGARYDALFGKFSGENASWDGLWDARTDIDAEGWSVEIAIPFTTLSFDPRVDAWRWNVQRVIRRRQETVRWTALSRAKRVTALEDFGELRGLHGQRQGLGLELRPYARVAHVDAAAPGASHTSTTGGFDVTYRISPTLTALATVNTDFAETEVDDRNIELSRFADFLPEKRDFFLQDAPLFSFGGLAADQAPYYSRRMGLGADGRPVDIIAGGRLTGRVGDTSVALLNVYQDAHGSVPAKNIGVARIARRVLAESSVGGIFTHGDPHSAGGAWLAGLDASFQNSRLPGGRMLIVNTYYMHSDADRAGGGGSAFGFDIDYPNEPVDVHIYFRQWGEHFEPTLGFIERPGVRYYVVSVDYLWRPNTRWLRSIEVELEPSVTTDLDNRLLSAEHLIPTLTMESPAGDSFELEVVALREVLDEPFQIWPGVVLPPGSYGFGQMKATVQSSAARPLSLGLAVRHGDFYSGTQTAFRPSLDWRPSRHLTLGVIYLQRQIRMPHGSFNARLLQAQMVLAVTPDLSWSTVLQYENKSRNVGINSRIRWTWRPGNDLFLVWGQGWFSIDDRLLRQHTELIVKVGATMRF